MYTFVVNNLLAIAKWNEQKQNQNVNKRSNIMNAGNGMEWDKNSIALQIIIRWMAAAKVNG